ncbi:MAG: 4'-phosphopantetheinyl transferase superfamily protein [Anaerolineae bacterium]
MSLPHWRLPPEQLTLNLCNEVHVWRSLLDLPGEYVDRLAATLSAAERARADRFYFEPDRRHFIAAHGILRLILSRYLIDRRPAELRFIYNTYGKPALERAANDLDLSFSVSHSHDLAVYAITRGREVGIDVEYIRPDLAEERIAERFFAPGEVAVLRQLPKSSQPEAFFACWTRKEAYLKGRGEGLARPLNEFEIAVGPGKVSAPVQTCEDDTSQWSLHEICPGSGYVAALAVAGPIGPLSFWQWPVL